MNDYTPFMDQYPELKLRPVTEFPGHTKIQKYDYVQSLNPTSMKDSVHTHGVFFLIVKDGKFGIYMFDRGWIKNTSTIALKPEFDSIDFISVKDRSFGAIIKRKGKYGMLFWTYGTIINDKFTVPTIYDTMIKVENNRFKATKDGIVTYFDPTGHILK